MTQDNCSICLAEDCGAVCARCSGVEELRLEVERLRARINTEPAARERIARGGESVIDEAMTTFLLSHSAARAVVYGMMRNAAVTGYDAKMVEWYSPVASIEGKEHRALAFAKLCGQ